MSCFIVATRSLNAIVTKVKSEWYGNLAKCHASKEFANFAAFQIRIRVDDDAFEQSVVELLARANNAAYAGRYPGHENPEFKPSLYLFDDVRVTDAQALKHLQCLLYQLAEQPVIETPLFAALQALEKGWMSNLIATIPEYAAAEWA